MDNSMNISLDNVVEGKRHREMSKEGIFSVLSNEAIITYKPTRTSKKKKLAHKETPKKQINKKIKPSNKFS